MRPHIVVNMVLQFDDVDWNQNFKHVDCELAFMIADLQSLHALKNGTFSSTTMSVKLDMTLDCDLLEENGTTYVVIFYVKKNTFNETGLSHIRICKEELMTSTMPASVIVVSKSALCE